MADEPTPTTPLPPYSGAAGRCPKCLAIDPHTDWVAAGTPIEDLDTGTVFPGRFEPVEHMRRTCGNCGYRWREAPRDAPDGGDRDFEV